MATPIWEKAEALDLSMYDPTVYAPGIETAMKLFLEGGRAGYSCERIGRCALLQEVHDMHVSSVQDSALTSLL